MSDWLNWITFAAKILEVLLQIFGENGRIVKLVESKIIDRIDAALDPPDTPTVKQLDDPDYS